MQSNYSERQYRDPYQPIEKTHGITREMLQRCRQLHYPLRAEHIISVLRQSRGGADDDSRFGHRMRGAGAFADVLAQRFRVNCKRLDINVKAPVATRTGLFSPPERIAHTGASTQEALQIDLFS